MSQPRVQFTCSVLSGTGKAGKLPKDEYGYYTQPIGGLNVFNSAGDYYPYESAKHLFQNSSAFMRRISSGCLKSELGHPSPLPGQSMESFAQRVMTIDPKNVCAHIAEVWLDFENVKDKNGKPIIAMMGKIKPSGPHGAQLEESYNNPKEDVCFSIRAFTNDTRISGIKQRELLEVVTWDGNVVEPGIAQARKYYSPSLEAYSEAKFTKESIENAIKPIPGLAMESSIIKPITLFKMMGWDHTFLDENPKFMTW